MQLVLGRAHESSKKEIRHHVLRANKWEQLVLETLFHLLSSYILDTSNQLVIRVQQHITLSIQLCHHLSHFPVLAHPAMCISKLIVWAPTRCTLAGRAQTVDSSLSTIHAEKIQIC
jgi:hypothetical protein